ncbi:YdbL family protein [Azospirillum sp. SYSU D00513]|uniref:YdbL family protein n=1 Tax=Azospirillum sp. SYSU D00513 TaxID=2812561 RepID=UPI001A97D29C|nr:YdbL family protein [Azospirillum sp. SYSU D00513]
MKRLFATLALALLLNAGGPALLPALLPATAHAQDALATAKASGQIGEKPDGLVGAISPQAQALADKINAQRKARYAQIAQSNGTSIDKVQAVAGQQLIERTPPGQFIMNAAGQWVRK